VPRTGVVDVLVNGQNRFREFGGGSNEYRPGSSLKARLWRYRDVGEMTNIQTLFVVN
jgi:hypothetical protein